MIENSPPCNTINHYWSLWISLISHHHFSVCLVTVAAPWNQLQLRPSRWPLKGLEDEWWAEKMVVVAQKLLGHSLVFVAWWSQTKNRRGAGCSCQQDSWSCWKFFLTHVWKNWGKTVKFPIKVQVDGHPILEHIHLDANANVPKNPLVLYDWTGGF